MRLNSYKRELSTALAYVVLLVVVAIIAPSFFSGANLRDLALNQGDADGSAREAVRHALYHGDDFTKSEEIQAVLDTIEQSSQR